MLAAYLILVVVCLVGLAIRTAYEVLKKAGKIDPKNKLVFGVVFAGMCLMLLSWPLMSTVDPLPVAVPGAVRGVGLLGLAAGLCLAFGGLLQLRGVENIDHLVTGGLFSRLRHPMYTGFILWILGWVLYRGAAASLVAGLVCIANILYWRSLEESSMAAQFGEAYRQYRKTTWF